VFVNIPSYHKEQQKKKIKKKKAGKGLDRKKRYAKR